MILKILLYTGARRGELEVLQIKDFYEDEELYVIHTIGKGDKERTLYIPKIYIQKELSYYLNHGIKYVASTKSGKTMDGVETHALGHTNA
ncbi:hypothetical protein [Aliarcobacter butzleri]|uniref:hypothetical protein n=1 Tax=Aliarcobacter butzleri TaxID=28197 RepID=UPI00396AA8AF